MDEKPFRFLREEEIESGWDECFSQLTLLHKEVKRKLDPDSMVFFSEVEYLIRASRFQAEQAYIKEMQHLDGTKFSHPTTKEVRERNALMNYNNALCNANFRLSVLRSLIFAKRR